jgi:hypothetical protein
MASTSEYESPIEYDTEEEAKVNPKEVKVEIPAKCVEFFAKEMSDAHFRVCLCNK